MTLEIPLSKNTSPLHIKELSDLDNLYQGDNIFLLKMCTLKNNLLSNFLSHEPIWNYIFSMFHFQIFLPIFSCSLFFLCFVIIYIKHPILYDVIGSLKLLGILSSGQKQLPPKCYSWNKTFCFKYCWVPTGKGRNQFHLI